jgi:hypothetical protein
VEFLKRLFGQAEQRAAAVRAPAPEPAPAAPPPPATRRTASLRSFGRDRIGRIEELNLLGPFVRSPDGRLVLLCGTVVDYAAPDDRHGGYAVLEGNQVRAFGLAQRPQEGRIADNRTFIFNDWLHNGELCGRFMAFSAEGEQLIAKHFDANLFGNGLSADGRYAICQTASSPGSPDSNIVAAFDLLEKRELARWQPECGSAKDFEFDSAARTVDLLTNDGERETYDLVTGELQGREAWQTRRIARGDLRVIGAIVHDPADIAPDLLDQIRQGLSAAQSPANGWSSARAHRLEGELMERLGKPGEALTAYEQALLIDPQVGVAKRATALRRAAADPSQPRAPKKNRFQQHAERLGIRHEQILLEKGELKTWRHLSTDPFTPVELAALAHYEREGWSGCAAEGGLILTLIKAASFERLADRHADTFVEALYHQNAAWPEQFDTRALVMAVAASDKSRIARNWALISRTAGHSPAFYPRVGWNHVEQLYMALGPARLAEIAEVFATASYDLRAGWPDLTLWRGTDLCFVEVKSPTDQMHASQAKLISTLLVPLGFDTVLAEVKASK